MGEWPYNKHTQQTDSVLYRIMVYSAVVIIMCLFVYRMLDTILELEFEASLFTITILNITIVTTAE